MKKIIVQTRLELKMLINQQIKDNGFECDLNHIDVSNIQDLSYLFANSKFNGNISRWNVSNVKQMYGLFKGSNFNKNISNWDVSSVKYMNYMFYQSSFNQDISLWRPYRLILTDNMFHECKAPIPYWAQFEHASDRVVAITRYHLEKKLKEKLEEDFSFPDKKDIIKKI